MNKHKKQVNESVLVPKLIENVFFRVRKKNFSKQIAEESVAES